MQVSRWTDSQGLPAHLVGVALTQQAWKESYEARATACSLCAVKMSLVAGGGGFKRNMHQMMMDDGMDFGMMGVRPMPPDCRCSSMHHQLQLCDSR